MVKNTKGGKKYKKSKHTEPETVGPLITKRDGQMYAKVLKTLGNRRLTVLCDNGVTHLAIIPGKFKRRIWIDIDDIVMVSIRDYQENKVDIIYKYDDNDKRRLKKRGLLNWCIENEESNREYQGIYGIDEIDEELQYQPQPQPKQRNQNPSVSRTRKFIKQQQEEVAFENSDDDLDINVDDL